MKLRVLIGAALAAGVIGAGVFGVATLGGGSGDAQAQTVQHPGKSTSATGSSGVEQEARQDQAPGSASAQDGGASGGEDHEEADGGEQVENGTNGDDEPQNGNQPQDPQDPNDADDDGEPANPDPGAEDDVDTQIDWDQLCKLLGKCDDPDPVIEWDDVCKLLAKCDEPDPGIDWDQVCKLLGKCEPAPNWNPDLPIIVPGEDDPGPALPGGLDDVLFHPKDAEQPKPPSGDDLPVIDVEQAHGSIDINPSLFHVGERH